MVPSQHAPDTTIVERELQRGKQPHPKCSIVVGENGCGLKLSIHCESEIPWDMRFCSCTRSSSSLGVCARTYGTHPAAASPGVNGSVRDAHHHSVSLCHAPQRPSASIAATIADRLTSLSVKAASGWLAVIIWKQCGLRKGSEIAHLVQVSGTVTMSDQDRAGARIASIRKMRGWTARELADKAHVSYSLLGKVEAGSKPASPALIGAVARALRVDVPRITGQPYDAPHSSHQARLHDMIVAIRRSVDTYDLPDDGITPRSFEALSADVRQVSAWGQEARYVQISDVLPGLLDELSAAVYGAAEADRPALFGLLAEAYSGATSIANLLGFPDLRNQIVERIRWASELSGDPLRMQRVRWQRAASLMGVSAYTPALKLMDQVRSDLGDDISTMNDPTLSVYGSAHLRSAILSARAAKTNGGSPQDAWAHIAAAREVADRMGSDRNDYGLAFGPSNVAQHEVAVAVELEDGVEAVRRSRSVHLDVVVPAVRRGHHFIDLARGYAYAEDYTGSVRCLQEARRIAPQQTRLHPMARETVLSIAAARRGREELSLLASWMGVAV